MTEPAEQLPRPYPLRVRIVASDPVRRLGLQSILVAAGFRVVTRSEDIDVVLADGDVPPREGQAVLTLGAAEAGQAGLCRAMQRRRRSRPRCWPSLPGL